MQSGILRMPRRRYLEGRGAGPGIRPGQPTVRALDNLHHTPVKGHKGLGGAVPVEAAGITVRAAGTRLAPIQNVAIPCDRSQIQAMQARPPASSCEGHSRRTLNAVSQRFQSDPSLRTGHIRGHEDRVTPSGLSGHLCRHVRMALQKQDSSGAATFHSVSASTTMRGLVFPRADYPLTQKNGQPLPWYSSGRLRTCQDRARPHTCCPVCA